MTDIIAPGFNPGKPGENITNINPSQNAVGMTDIVAQGFNPGIQKNNTASIS
ncbi:hypothetical protein [Dyadobacter sp. 3J3]|uniref:hypothetical protein n=1 Tax=Dyadobacter sp. 3J3 TaxID=2606600 RepID=UPI001357CE9F|nr:hypothetical protein [Dyadobacter sp. 3J3]